MKKVFVVHIADDGKWRWPVHDEAHDGGES